MTFLEKDEPLEVAKNMQKWYFMYPRDNETFNRMLLIKQILLVIAIGLLDFVGLFGFIYRSFIDDIGNEWIEILQQITPFTGLILISVTYTFLGKRIKKLLERIHGITSRTPKELIRIYIITNKITWLTYLGLIFIVIIIISQNLYENRYCDDKAEKDKRYACGLINPAWYPFEVEGRVLTKIVITFGYDLGMLFYVPIFVVNAVAVIMIPLFLVARMQHLRKNLEEINTSNLDEFTKNFKYYVHYYSEICGCLQDSNDCIGYCYMLFYCFVSLSMAVSGYGAIILKDMSDSSVFVAELSGVWLICATGQSLENEHEKLIRCVYSIPWYEMNAKMKINYSSFLGMVLRSVHMRNGPLGVFNYPLLLVIYRRVYSIITFLINSSNS